jgi:hypothetical protein
VDFRLGGLMLVVIKPDIRPSACGNNFLAGNAVWETTQNHQPAVVLRRIIPVLETLLSP